MLLTSGNSLQRCSGLAAELPPAVCGIDHLPRVTLGPGCTQHSKHTTEKRKIACVSCILIHDLSISIKVYCRHTNVFFPASHHCIFLFYSKSRVILPMMPTAKYPSKAKTKIIQQRISVQPLKREKEHYAPCHKKQN